MAEGCSGPKLLNSQHPRNGAGEQCQERRIPEPNIDSKGPSQEPGALKCASLYFRMVPKPFKLTIQFNHHTAQKGLRLHSYSSFSSFMFLRHCEFYVLF